MKKRVIVLLILSVFLATTGLCSAHEMYINVSNGKVTTVNLRWNQKNSSTGRLKINADGSYLSGDWAGTNYNSAKTAWHSSQVPVECVEFPTNPNTYFCTTSKEYWKSKIPDILWGEIMAYTELYDTNGKIINSYDEANASTKQIKGANIYVKPNPTNNTTFDYASTMSHEIGHVLCLGHSHLTEYSPADTTKDPSIMSYNYLALKKSYNPQNHELNDVKNMYGY